ncbi:MAG: cupin domain-containing protein [Bryobacterales bacterium]|nr:cupin domain-containing protein [Bryobacterales bacterium]
MRICILALLMAALAWTAERPVDPTYLKTSIQDAKPAADDLCARDCEYKPLFRQGGVVRGVARYGVLRLTAGQSSAIVDYPREEQVYYVMEGAGQVVYGGERHSIQKGDFLYLPAGVPHGVTAPGQDAVQVVVMGFLLPKSVEPRRPEKLLKANLSEVKKQVVGNHPPSTLYQLMMGDWNSTRDRLASGHVLTSLFVMEFAPGGTNFPHHHDREEEIYLLLDGEGDMVAGSGMDGVEGRFPAKPGDAYFYRLNATVGFYNSMKGQAHILAIRSLYPFTR